jgi:hypothetical protein
MNMPENLYLEFDAFLRSIKQNLDGSFGVLLGAGASHLVFNRQMIVYGIGNF